MSHPDPAVAIISLERAALDRWGKGDPSVYLELFEPDITYFDPMQKRRVDGAQAMTELFEPIAGKIRVDRYDLLHPAVQHGGDLAVLTFNLVSYRTDDGVERAIARWNATEVYRHSTAGWRIAHSHWSYTTPELKDAVSVSEVA